MVLRSVRRISYRDNWLVKMGEKYSEISDKLQAFIQSQKIFFVATATSDGRVNLSPKGMETFYIVGKNRVLWLNLTGSGNETAAHLRENDRMTIMFCAFSGAPMILRLYGHARITHPRDGVWEELISRFPPIPGARQVVDMAVDLVDTSCGFGVPLMDFAGERGHLDRWAEKKGEDGLRDFMRKWNQFSIDGKPTGIFES